MRSFGICNLSVIPLRAEASDKSEIITQLLFGDHFEIIEHRENWVFIKAAYDDYEGWMDPKQYIPVDEQTYNKLNGQNTISGLVFSQSLKFSNGEIINLAPGSTLPCFSNGQLKINNEKYEFSGVALKPDPSKFESEIASAAKFYLHTPYLWGGKSTFGIDCSGFTQMIFKHFGIKIRRDAWQQAGQGKTVNSLSRSKPGDLAFFDNTEGRVIHVGILLDNKEIIHASGRVRIDSVDVQGIYSKESGKYTHKLKVIKRYI